MSLNIKNERVHELARRAAARTGKTQTGVIEDAPRRYLGGRGDDPRRVRGVSRFLDRLIVDLKIEVVPVTPDQARIARGAYRDFGTGSGHPARLDFGDCFAYALAIDTNEPLLFKGDDFAHTDVLRAG